MKILFAIGLTVYSIGLFGVWLQGEFWWITFGKYSHSDLSALSSTRQAMFLPELFILTGGLLIAWTVFVRIERSKKREWWIALLIALLAVPVWMTGTIAGTKVFKKSRAALDEYFETALEQSEPGTRPNSDSAVAPSE